MDIECTSIGFLDCLQNESSTAWTRLSEIYTPLIRSRLRRQGVSGDDADDITQDVMLVVLRRVSEFERCRTGSFRCWLRRITANCLSEFRRKNRRYSGVNDELLQQLEDPESELSRRWDVEHDLHVLRYAMSKLESEFSANTWKAFKLSALAGRRPSEVAAELGISENAVCIAKSRVSARIRAMTKGLLN